MEAKMPELILTGGSIAATVLTVVLTCGVGL